VKLQAQVLRRRSRINLPAVLASWWRDAGFSG
jgi:hypothetical protein